MSSPRSFTMYLSEVFDNDKQFIKMLLISFFSKENAPQALYGILFVFATLCARALTFVNDIVHNLKVHFHLGKPASESPSEAVSVSDDQPCSPAPEALVHLGEGALLKPRALCRRTRCRFKIQWTAVSTIYFPIFFFYLCNHRPLQVQPLRCPTPIP